MYRPYEERDQESDEAVAKLAFASILEEIQVLQQVIIYSPIQQTLITQTVPSDFRGTVFQKRPIPQVHPLTGVVLLHVDRVVIRAKFHERNSFFRPIITRYRYGIVSSTIAKRKNFLCEWFLCE